MSEFGEILGKRLQALGMSQRDLGPLVGLDATQINKLVNGRREAPKDARKILAMVKALRLDGEAAKRFVGLAGLSSEVLTATVPGTHRVPLLAQGGGFNFPDVKAGESDVLLAKVRQLLEAPEHTPQQRYEIHQHLESFISWLEFRFDERKVAP